jgi:phage/plasmid-like protein (TIGR03299 family)
MAHQVETMAWTNEMPWHGLGVRVDKFNSVEHLITAAGLNWEINLAPVCPVIDGAHGPIIDDKFALVRSSDSAVLDIVGSRYQPVQNADAFEFFRDFVEAGNATLETAGSLRGGRYVWGLANMHTSFFAGARDRVKNYLLVGAPHESGKSLIARYTSVRVVCNNTLTLALSSGSNVFKWTHNTVFDGNAILAGKKLLADAAQVAEEFEENAEKLVEIKLDASRVKEILARIVMPECLKPGAKITPQDIARDFDELASRPLKNILQAYTLAPGATPGTGWGALNAFTYWADHMASHNPDNRLTNAWIGRTANQKSAVLDSLLALAA